MGAGDFVYEGASGLGVAVGREEICGLLDGNGSAGEEFSGDEFVVNTRDFAFQFFDGGGGFVGRARVGDRKEKDDAETQRTQSRRRDG